MDEVNGLIGDREKGKVRQRVRQTMRKLKKKNEKKVLNSERGEKCRDPGIAQNKTKVSPHAHSRQAGGYMKGKKGTLCCSAREAGKTGHKKQSGEKGKEKGVC